MAEVQERYSVVEQFSVIMLSATVDIIFTSVASYGIRIRNTSHVSMLAERRPKCGSKYGNYRLSICVFKHHHNTKVFLVETILLLHVEGFQLTFLVKRK